MDYITLFRHFEDDQQKIEEAKVAEWSLHKENSVLRGSSRAGQERK